ncbi:MAG TPA: thiamine pyrophosphate-binding protein [Chloroflexota bacterium]|nr:thiamine pyrophosphate-binding protein [Chloroflexota bacterium]
MAASTATLQAASVLDELSRCGVTHIVWLPDSETGFLYEAILQSPITLVPVCREGESMAIAAGLIMGGKRPVVLIQSTGFFESGDSIRGLCLDLHLPLLLMLGYRGYAGPGRTAADSAARYLEPLLGAWGIPYYVVDSDATCHYISQAYQQAQASSHPVAVLVGKEYHR